MPLSELLIALKETKKTLGDSQNKLDEILGDFNKVYKTAATA